MTTDLTRFLFSYVAASILWIADTASDYLHSGLPTWIERFGLPVAMLIVSCMAIVWLFKAFLNERKDRINDRDKVIEQLRSDAVKAADDRAQLLIATKAQTAATERQTLVFENMVIRLHDCPFVTEQLKKAHEQAN